MFVWQTNQKCLKKYVETLVLVAQVGEELLIISDPLSNLRRPSTGLPPGREWERLDYMARKPIH